MTLFSPYHRLVHVYMFTILYFRYLSYSSVILTSEFNFRIFMLLRVHSKIKSSRIKSVVQYLSTDPSCLHIKRNPRFQYKLKFTLAKHCLSAHVMFSHTSSTSRALGRGKKKLRHWDFCLLLTVFQAGVASGGNFVSQTHLDFLVYRLDVSISLVNITRIKVHSVDKYNC